MVRILFIIVALGLYGPCSKRRPDPLPTPTPTPTATPTPEPSPEPSPTPSPVAKAIPYPTPVVDLNAYLPAAPTGKTVTVSGENLAEKIQAAQDDPEIAAVRIAGGGSFEPFIVRKYTTFDASTYSCDVTPASIPAFLARLPKVEADIFRVIPFTDHGCVIIADNVYVGGTWRFPREILELMRAPGDPIERAKRMALIPPGEGTTILEPTFSIDAARPAVEVFQALGDVGRSHTGKAKNITIQGFKIKGRQTVYDGGVRSTVLLGNCEHCAVTSVYLEDTASIGVTAGGSGLELNNFARDIVFTQNMFSGVAAANIATINTEGARVFENYVKRPGHHDPKFGGGVCGYDHETNSAADHTKDIWVYNNFYDYEDAHIDGSGNAICAQDPYVGTKQTDNNFFIVNNFAIGGRDTGTRRFMSNGIYLVGLRVFTVSNNYVFRTGQNAIQAYNLDKGIIEDTVFDSTGGGGNPSFWAKGMRDTIVRRNNFLTRDIGINMEAGFASICGERNVFQDNFIPGVGPNAPATEKCP